MKIILKKAWAASEPNPLMRRNLLPISRVFFVFTKKNYNLPRSKPSPGPRPTFAACFKELNYLLKGDTRKYFDIRYNFLIGPSGNVFEGRGWLYLPQLPVKHFRVTRKSLYVSYLGDFSGMDDEDGSPAWLVPRGSWGAEQSRHLSHLHTTPGSVFVTYSGKNPCTNREWCVFAIRKLQQAHIYSRNCPDIRYNFCIGGDGKVYEGRGWEVRPTLPRKYSDFTCTSLYIAYMGNFLHKQPGDIMHRALETLLVYGVQNKFIRPKFLQFRI